MDDALAMLTQLGNSLKLMQLLSVTVIEVVTKIKYIIGLFNYKKAYSIITLLLMNKNDDRALYSKIFILIRNVCLVFL